MQICASHHKSGWRRLGSDVYYSSHEHQVEVQMRLVPGVIKGDDPWAEMDLTRGRGRGTVNVEWRQRAAVGT
jgi:hypothetical protein